MSDGLKTTFDVLCGTENEAAGRVLIPALDSRFPSVRDRALEGLLSRRNLAGHREIIARLHTFDDSWRRKVEENHARLVPALREALISADRQMCVNGCRAAVGLRQYDLTAAILTGLEDRDNPNAAVLSETLLDLAELLCEELAAPRQRNPGGDAQFVRRRVVGALGTSVSRFARHNRREIIEAFLLLTYRDDAVLRQVLHDPYHPAFVVLVEMLSKTPHDAVIGLLLSFLDDARAPSAVLSIVAKRSDQKFVERLLRKVGREPGLHVAHNLKRIETLAWACQTDVLDACDEMEQSAAVWLANVSGVPRAQAFSLVEHLLRQGKPGGRRAAAEALDQYRGADANLLALEALDDEDPEVQARILVQLRSRGIPGALARLVEMVDSPHQSVRTAARRCLAEFTFARYLASFDLLDDEVRSSTGELVRKVDPHAAELLRAELASPVRSRRLRGLAAARALQMVAEVEDAVLAQTSDEDHLVRAEAVAALGQSSSKAARDALAEAALDRSPAVRDAARKSLFSHCQAAPPPEAGATVDSVGWVSRPVSDGSGEPSYSALIAGLMFAERGGGGLGDRMADELRSGRVQMDSTRLLTMLLGLAAIVLVVWLVSFLSEDRRRPATYHSPWRLFLALAKAHRLSWPDVWLLWRLARFHDLNDPARLFLEPERFDREGLSRPLLRHAPRLQSIRNRLFADLAPP